MRTILHSDLNNFYASVECVYDPSLKGRPIAVCGNPDARHGIVLAKNMPAKLAGVQTGEAIWHGKSVRIFRYCLQTLKSTCAFRG